MIRSTFFWHFVKPNYFWNDTFLILQHLSSTYGYDIYSSMNKSWFVLLMKCLLKKSWYVSAVLISRKKKKKSVLKITKQKVQIYFRYFSAILAKTWAQGRNVDYDF